MRAITRRCGSPCGDLRIELAIPPKDIVVVERDPTIRCDVALDTRSCEDFVVQCAQSWVRRERFAARLREGIAKTRDHLRHGQVSVGDLVADESRPAR